jgi:hypothetical protein
MSKWWHNSSYHTSTKSTPLEPVYGYPTKFYQLQTMKQWIHISEKDHKYYKQSKAEINQKLTYWYFRPFKIKARVRDVACCLDKEQAGGTKALTIRLRGETATRSGRSNRSSGALHQTKN